MITILCSGSRGDVQPYIALAAELKRLGRDVRIATGKSFADLIEGNGIECYPLAADVHSAEIDPALLKAAQTSDSPLKMLLTFRKMKKYALLMTEDMFNACEGSEIIVYHPGCAIGYYAAQMMGIPAVMAAPFPLHKTKEFASVIAYGRSHMPTALSYSLLQSMLWTASKLGVASCLKAKLGKLPKNFGSPLERVDPAHPAVISCSNFVFPRPSDWNENIHQHGYWFLEDLRYSPPRELADFLCEGEPPVYFGFGSVFSPSEKQHFVKEITEALRQTGQRGIVCGMGEVHDLPGNIFAMESVPHSWLFSRMAAVCHHGGAGTTAAGFKAGIPSIIVPFSNDQFAWAHRAYDLGVGAKPIGKKKLSADSLAAAIEFALSPGVKEKAAALGEKISQEQGARKCAEVIARL